MTDCHHLRCLDRIGNVDVIIITADGGKAELLFLTEYADIRLQQLDHIFLMSLKTDFEVWGTCVTPRTTRNVLRFAILSK